MKRDALIWWLLATVAFAFDVIVILVFLTGCAASDHQHVFYATKSEVSYLKARVGDLEDRIGAQSIAIKPPSLSEQIALIAAATRPPEKPPEGFVERIPGTVWAGAGTLILAVAGGLTYLIKRGMKEPETEA